MKKVLSILAAFVFTFVVVGVAYAASGTSPQTDTFAVNANVSAEISITCGADVTMTPNIPGITGGTASSDSAPITCTLISQNNEGWELALKYNNVLRKDAGGANKQFADYTNAVGTTPDYGWQAPAAGNAEFGFAVQAGTYAVQSFKDDDSTCNAAAGSVGSPYCWYKLATSDLKVAENTAATDLDGEDTAFIFKAQLVANAGFYLQEGGYTTTVTATATNK